MVYDYIISSYPEKQTSYIITFGTQKALGTIDALCRIYNIPLAEGKTIKSAFTENHAKLMNKFPILFDEYKGEKLGFCSEAEIDYIKNFAVKKGFASDDPIIKEVITYHKGNTADLREKYPNLVKYYNGLFGVPVSQSMHPAGIIVAPSYVDLPSQYGVFRNDDKRIICIDMDLCHDVSLVKYDILGLKQMQILRISGENAKIRIPFSHEMDWDDPVVWKHMLDSPVGLFQFEGSYAFKLLSEFKPHHIDDMTIVNAALRPSGASYRKDLIAGIKNKNPSKTIDDLLAANNGYLIFQEDIIRFLQEICGLSGSEADNIRRGIAHKDEKRLEEAMPNILKGYCNKSDKPREESENDAKKFIQIIKDASSYMFGRNHATGYSMVGYKCIFFRTYFPAEFIVGYLNSAKDLDDIIKGDDLSNTLDISYLNEPIVRQKKVDIINKFSDANISVDDLPKYPNRIIIHRPTFGKSRGNYTLDPENYAIYKGVGSVKGLSFGSADELYELAKKPEYQNIEKLTKKERKILFYYLIKDCITNTTIKKNQLELLIKLNFFYMFGSDQTLLNIFNNVRSLTGDFKFENINNKAFKKEYIPFLDINMDVFNTLSYKETDKTYKDIDMDKYFELAIPTFEDESIPLAERLKFEIDNAGSYLTRINSKVPYYFVDKIRVYQYKNKPYFDLFNLKTGQYEHYSVIDPKYYINNAVSEGDILTGCKFDKVKKKTKVDGKYIETDQYKNIITAWSKSKKFG